MITKNGEYMENVVDRIKVGDVVRVVHLKSGNVEWNMFNRFQICKIIRITEDEQFICRDPRGDTYKWDLKRLPLNNIESIEIWNT